MFTIKKGKKSEFNVFAIGLMSRVFANDLEDWGSIPG